MLWNKEIKRVNSKEETIDYWRKTWRCFNRRTGYAFTIMNINFLLKIPSIKIVHSNSCAKQTVIYQHGCMSG